MTQHEKEMLLACLKHYMTPELRQKVMKEVPQAYNAWMGYEVVKVVFADKHDPQEV